MKRKKRPRLRCAFCKRVATGFLAGHPHCGHAHVYVPPSLRRRT